MKQFRWTAAEVCAALELPAEPGDDGLEFPAVSTDTRGLGAGHLFVALRGERFDAHEFLGAAAEAGARGAVVDRRPEGGPAGLRFFVVPDTLAALGRLANHRRRALRARVVGVVGSNGKTTTKDLLQAALGGRFRVHATQGNLNNLVGLPLTLLAAPDEAEALVLEMGTDQPGEIERLTRIAEPHAAIVTAIGEEHLEKLGDLQGVLEEETQVLRGIADDGVVLVAEEPESLPRRAREMVGAERVRVAGFGAAADLRPDGGADAVEVLPDGTTRWSWAGGPLHLPLPGRHNVRNALLALGLATEWGVEPAAARRGIEAMPAPKLRGEWHRVGRMRVLADCYNANPPSLAAAIDLLAALPADAPKVAVVGTMREMGTDSAALHRRSAELIAERVGSGIDRVVATGEFVAAFEASAASLGERLLRHDDPIAAFEALAPSLRGDETILLKASRGEALERWIPLLQGREEGRGKREER